MKNTFVPGLAFIISILITGQVDAAVVDSTQFGFTVKHEKNVQADPVALYNLFCKDIGKWWDPEHTWSGHSENLYIQSYPGGSFGEQMETGKAVIHMRVIHLDPGKLLRMEGALGPLQQFAVTGVMSLEFKKAGDSTHVTLTYAVGGYVPGGVSKFAAPVDYVLGIQLKRFIAYAEQKK
jgi:hypothetical protein